MTGKFQGEAVAVLRSVAPNAVVALVVSRQVVDDAEVLALTSAVCVSTHFSFGMRRTPSKDTQMDQRTYLFVRLSVRGVNPADGRSTMNLRGRR